jgi:H+/Cl- antiporter ClcA
MRKRIRHTRIRLSSKRLWKRRLVFWSGALAVGGAAALFAILAQQAEHLFREIIKFSPYLPLILTPAALVSISLATRRYFPNAQGSGIPQTVAAIEVASHEARKKLLSLRIAIGKILMSLLGLLFGASIGREGPTVHIGASILFTMGRYAHFPRHDLDRGLILAGGAAGIAAAFNTPLAGIVFAIEELSRSFEERSSGTMLTAVLIAGILALSILGEYSYFGESHATLPLDLTGVGVILVCGLLGGAMGGLFASGLIHGTRSVAPHINNHPILIPALCGLALALIGLLSGSTTYGTGYQEAQAIINNPGEADLLYPLLKMAATFSSFLSGIPGGIFAPSLAAGAGMGAGFAQWFPAELLSAVILLGMVGYFSGVVQTPITAFVIVMEMTDNQQMLLPLMATAFIAYGASKLFCPKPIYRALAEGFIHREKS